MNKFEGEILALDLATRFGWAEGAPGTEPRYGSERFAPAGSSHAAVFGGAIKWLATRLSAFKPARIVIEAPMNPNMMQGRTNAKTGRLLLGLPAVIEGTAFRFGVYDVKEARVADVRHHFIGSNPRGATGKQQTIARCRQLGWKPADDNAADALALWHYAMCMADSAASLRSTELFK